MSSSSSLRHRSPGVGMEPNAPPHRAQLGIGGGSLARLFCESVIKASHGREHAIKKKIDILNINILALV